MIIETHRWLKNSSAYTRPPDIRGKNTQGRAPPSRQVHHHASSFLVFFLVAASRTHDHHRPIYTIVLKGDIVILYDITVQWSSGLWTFTETAKISQHANRTHIRCYIGDGYENWWYHSCEEIKSKQPRSRKQQQHHLVTTVAFGLAHGIVNLLPETRTPIIIMMFLNQTKLATVVVACWLWSCVMNNHTTRH
jgi:hypothetical protein